MSGENPLNILLLVDSLPDEAGPDPYFRSKNIFVQKQVTAVAARNRVDYPLLVPRLQKVVKGLYALRGLRLHFPRAREGVIKDIRFSSVRYCYLPRYYSKSKYRALRKHLKKQGEKYDLIHCHTVYDLGLVGLELKEELGLPLLVTVYGTDVNWLFEKGGRGASPAIAEATRKVLKGADAVIGVSRDLGRKVRQIGVKEERIHWVPNGVDKELFSPGYKFQERERLGLGKDEKIILYVGNLIETKGLGDLVEALGIMKTQGDSLPAMKLLLVGPKADYQAELMRMINQRGLEAHVSFLGPVPHEEIPILMRAADVFCLPSWREGWPCSVVEAMACGLPVVATEVGGTPEIVTGPELGCLCPAHEPQKLADSLIAAITREWNPGFIASAVESYGYDKLAGRLDFIYREVLSNSVG